MDGNNYSPVKERAERKVHTQIQLLERHRRERGDEKFSVQPEIVALIERHAVKHGVAPLFSFFAECSIAPSVNGVTASFPTFEHADMAKQKFGLVLQSQYPQQTITYAFPKGAWRNKPSCRHQCAKAMQRLNPHRDYPVDTCECYRCEHETRRKTDAMKENAE